MRFEFEWDPVKADNNRKKHGVSFELALLVFRDPLALVVPDDRYHNRWRTIGEIEGKVVVVAHIDVERTDYEGQACTRIRIISARLATRREQQDYRYQR
jgi:uncharacterized protein